jgi:hypothetical protein
MRLVNVTEMPCCTAVVSFPDRALRKYAVFERLTEG